MRIVLSDKQRSEIIDALDQAYRAVELNLESDKLMRHSILKILIALDPDYKILADFHDWPF